MVIGGIDDLLQGGVAEVMEKTTGVCTSEGYNPCAASMSQLCESFGLCNQG